MIEINKVNHPIYAIENGNLLAKEKGLFSYGFKLSLPSIYGKNVGDFDEIRSVYNRLIDLLDENYIIHKSNYFFKNDYKGERLNESFVEEFNFEHFKNRKVREQHSYLFITKVPKSYMKYDSLKTNSFLKKENKGMLFNPIIDKEYISESSVMEFERTKEQVSKLLIDSILQAEILDENGYIDVFDKWEKLSLKTISSDVIIEDGFIKISDKAYRTFTIENLEQLPDLLPEYSIAFEKSEDSMPIPKSLLSPLGLEIKENHVLNEYFYIPPQEEYLKELKKQENRLKNFANFLRKDNTTEKGSTIEEEQNKVYKDQLTEFRQELTQNSQKLVLTHVNVIAEDISITDTNFPLSIRENKVDTTDIYFATCAGNAVGLPTDLYMPLTQEQAFSFFYAEDFTKGNSPYGFRVIDMLSGNPIHLDIFRTLKKNKDINNYNAWGVGESGSGKSFSWNKILAHQYYVGDHVFNIDGSSSFERATEFINYESKGKHGFFMKISNSTKIGLNPFILIEGESKIDKVEFLSQLLLNILEIEDSQEQNITGTLFKLVLSKYYESKAKEYSFNSFYEYFDSNVEEVLQREGIAELINPKLILFLLKDYYKGGTYEFLLNNSDERLKNLKNNRYITFQVKELKENIKLFSIVTFLLTNLYREKLYAPELLDRIKFIHYDEVWTAMDKPVLVKFIQDTIKTVRSQNGATIFTSQEPEDFFENEIIKNAVINNSELGVIMNLEKYKGKAKYVQELLSLTETQRNVLFSLGKKIPEGINCREFALLVGRKRIETYGMEVSLEERAIYESDPEEKVILMKIDETSCSPMDTARIYAEQKRSHQSNI